MTGHAQDVPRARLTSQSPQPIPTGFVIALLRMGLPESELDHVLHVLLVIAECYRRIAREGLPQITDEMLEESAKRINAVGRLLEGESDETEWTTGLIVEEHPERDLFIYIMNYLDEQGLTRPSRMHKHAVFAAAVVLDAFMQAAAQAGGAAE